VVGFKEWMTLIQVVLMMKRTEQLPKPMKPLFGIYLLGGAGVSHLLCEVMKSD